MPNTVANMLGAARRSMEEMILPSLETANPLAREQAQLVIQALGFIESRLSCLHARDRAEMLAYAAIAREVMALDLTGIDRETVGALRQALEDSDRLEADANPPDRDLQQAGQRLADAIAELVRSLGSVAEASRRDVRKAVVAGTERVLDIHRAFFEPTGFDKAASALPPLDALLHGEDRSARA